MKKFITRDSHKIIILVVVWLTVFIPLVLRATPYFYLFLSFIIFTPIYFFFLALNGSLKRWKKKPLLTFGWKVFVGGFLISTITIPFFIAGVLSYEDLCFRQTIKGPIYKEETCPKSYEYFIHSFTDDEIRFFSIASMVAGIGASIVVLPAPYFISSTIFRKKS